MPELVSESLANALRAEVFIGVLGILATMLVPLLSRSRRNLFFDIIAESKLANFPDGRLFVIDVRNAAGRFLGWLAGGRDIDRSQYERPLTFSFGTNARIREAGVIEERPDSIDARVSIDRLRRDKLVLDPVLLNEGDLVRLKAVIEKRRNLKESQNPQQRIAQYNVTANGRILGIQKIEKKQSSKELAGKFVLLSLFGALLLLPAVLVLELLDLDSPEGETWILVPYLVLNLTSAILAIILLAVVVWREAEASRITKCLSSSYHTAERVTGVKQMLESIAFKKPSDPARQRRSDSC